MAITVTMGKKMKRDVLASTNRGRRKLKRKRNVQKKGARGRGISLFGGVPDQAGRGGGAKH